MTILFSTPMVLTTSCHLTTTPTSGGGDKDINYSPKEHPPSIPYRRQESMAQKATKSSLTWRTAELLSWTYCPLLQHVLWYNFSTNAVRISCVDFHASTSNIYGTHTRYAFPSIAIRVPRKCHFVH
ncbi:hypothetical protein QYF36_021873 [Acer negundo]|nr:hypothetical protein QYF36_021873 [Acer negundo]